jgi:acyl carrier protein
LDIEEQIAGFIAENFLLAETDEGFDEDSSFIEKEILDSTGILQLVLFIEQTFGISVEGQEITPENFDSVRRVANLVRRRLP